MQTRESVTSGVSSARLTGWRPAWEGWSALAGFAAAGSTLALVPGTWGCGTRLRSGPHGGRARGRSAPHGRKAHSGSRALRPPSFARKTSSASSGKGDERQSRGRPFPPKPRTMPTPPARCLRATKRGASLYSNPCASMRDERGRASRTCGSAAGSNGRPRTRRRSTNSPRPR